MSDYPAQEPGNTQSVIAAEAAGSHAQVGRYWKALLAGEFQQVGLPLNVHSNKYENARAVKTGVGILFGFSAFSSAAAAQFVQVFDMPRAPSTGDVPAAVFTVAAAGHLAISYIFPGRFFLSGCWIVNSSTGPTYTAGAADTFFDAQYI